ncbi:MAG: DNA polymerase/3'-5' exonuclease PolX [Myxococcaceae bacterium]|nr:DNA polymerase/3'-5' exonuclease PolX [Myxococcaceae bacterium]
MVLNDKTAVVKALRDLSLYLQLQGENSFKTRAYDIAAERIAGLAEDIGELVASGGLTALPGIGASIAAKITELVTTGAMGTLDELKAKYPPKVLELLDVPELGPKKVKALVEQLQVGTLDQLEAACRDGRVRALKGFGEKTEGKILEGIALARRSKAGGRKRLADVLPTAEALLQVVQAAPGVQRAALGGSVRRRRETVADVDLIASAKDAAPVFKALTSHPQVAQVIADGTSKASVRLKDGDLQVDLRVLPDEDFATALHHFTGSKAHHIRLRGLAQDQGLKISEWGVHRGDEKLPIREEAEIYELLGLQPVPPELREDTGEFEAAAKRALPTDLVALGDIKGNVHAHSTWSDGQHTLEQMAAAGLMLGLEYLTVTEHSETAGYANGLDADRLKRQADEIDALNEKMQGRLVLLKGIETDILEDGSLDYPDSVLEKLDVVIGSIHTRHSQDEAAMTRRVLNAMENPHLMIWGHPTGRLLLKRDPAPMRIEVLLDKAAEKGIAVEVNGGPERLDLKADHVRLALERGVKLTASTDAHSVGELERNLPLAVFTARKGWARRGDVLNTLSLGDFRKALRRR